MVITNLLYQNATQQKVVLIPAQIPVVCYGDNEAINILPRAVALTAG